MKDLLVRINGAPLPPVPAQPVAQPPADEEIPIKRLREITDQYSPTPAATAELWLVELEKFWGSPADHPGSFEELVADLPGPGAWPRLSALMEEWRAPEPRSALHTASARVIVFFLNGELAKAEKAVQDLDTAARGIAFTDREAVFALIEELRSHSGTGAKDRCAAGCRRVPQDH